MTSRTPAWSGAAAALLSGVLLALSRDVGPAGPLMLVAPVPVLAYALCSSRWRNAAAVAFAAQLIGALSLAWAYGSVLPPVPLTLLILLQSLVQTSIVLATRWVARGASMPLALYSYPTLSAATEFLFGLAAPHGSFGATGYAFVDLLPLLQLASLGGMTAVTFAGGVFAMILAMLLVEPQRWRGLLLLGGIPLALALSCGAMRLNQPYSGGARIALGAIDSLTGRALRSDADSQAVAVAYARLARLLANREPDIIVFPEKVLAQRSAPIRAAARTTGIPIVAGFDEMLADGRRANSARLFRADGSDLRYLKRKLIPGLELGYAVGKGPLVAGDRGIAICKDMDFAPMIRGYGRQDVRLMLVPAWDFVVDGRLHARMAVMRGVENGFAVARAAAEGRLTVSDRYGRVVAEATSAPGKATELVADVGLRGGGTLYARIGDLFGWLTVAAAGLLLMDRIRHGVGGYRTSRRVRPGLLPA